MSLIFYDTETAGTVRGFDQILQFGAVLTDAGLVEIERFDIRSRLLPHVVPSPAALLVTGMGIDDILDDSRPSHYQMVCEIRRVLTGWRPGTFIGFNSVSFDEEFLRQ